MARPPTPAIAALAAVLVVLEGGTGLGAPPRGPIGARGAIGAPGAPRGRVVRVERKRGPGPPPQICDVSADKGGNCFGDEPKVGDTIVLLDESGAVGEARIVETSAFMLAGRGTKACEGLWSIKTELVRGDLTSSLGRTMGLVDPTMSARRGHLMPKDQLTSPSGRTDDMPAVGFDRDGDKVADVVLSQTTCDGAGSMCIEEWVRTGGRMVMVRQVNFANCGL